MGRTGVHSRQSPVVWISGWGAKERLAGLARKVQLWGYPASKGLGRGNSNVG